jgi:hypothetical protein
MRVHHIDALSETIDFEMNVKEVRTLMKAIFSVKDQKEDMLAIGSQLYSISSMFRELADLA